MSSSHERKIDAYLKPTNLKLVENYSKGNNVSKSRAVNELLEKIPDKMKQEILKKR